MKVKCIDDTDSSGLLQNNKVYEAKEMGVFYIIDGIGWMEERFQVVREDTTIPITELPATKKYPNQCPCGIAAAICDYHKP